MPFVPADGVITVQLIYDSDGQKIQNVLNFDVPNSTNSDTALELCENLVTWFDDHVKGILPTTVKLERIDANDASDEHGYSITYTDDLPIAGTLTGAAVYPNNVTAAIKQTTAGRGRAYRGRSYFPALTGAAVNVNTLSGAYVAALKLAWEFLISIPMIAGSAELSVVSKFLNGAARTAALVSHVLEIFVDPTVDSQRRRLPGRGR